MRWQQLEERSVSRAAVRAGAAAVGALALGALAVGGLAIGFLAVRHFAVARSRFDQVTVNDLLVKRLRVGDLVITGTIRSAAR